MLPTQVTPAPQSRDWAGDGGGGGGGGGSGGGGGAEDDGYTLAGSTGKNGWTRPTGADFVDEGPPPDPKGGLKDRS